MSEEHTYRAKPGQHISHAAADACDMANEQAAPVVLVFNNIRVPVQPGQTADNVVAAWGIGQEAAAEARRASDAGKPAAFPGGGRTMSVEPAMILAALTRVEQRQAAYEQVAHRILSTMEVHNEKLDAILEAATQETGPSPVAQALQDLVASVQEQTRLLTSLPGVLAVAIREELERADDDPEMEPAGPGAFD